MPFSRFLAPQRAARRLAVIGSTVAAAAMLSGCIGGGGDLVVASAPASDAASAVGAGVHDASTASIASASLPRMPRGARVMPASGRIDAVSGQVIRGLRISNPAGPCIVIPQGVTDVTIASNVIGPCGPAGMEDYGVFILQNATRVTIEGNTFNDVGSGVKAYRALNPIVVDDNVFTNVRGPLYNGQAVQLNGVSGSGGQTRITCNVSDDVNRTSGIEDHISLYASSGSEGQPMLVAWNRMRGGKSPTGGGITVGDHGGSWIHVLENTLVHVANSGIGVAGGTDILVENNRVDNRGADASTLTHQAYFVRAFSSCARITVRGNRGISRKWNWNERNGELYAGYRHGPELCASVVDWQNNVWGDTSLNAAMFDEEPLPCR